MDATDVYGPKIPFYASTTILMEPKELLKKHWKLRAELSADNWGLSFIVRDLHSKQVCGTALIRAHNFATTKTVHTATSLRATHHNQGIGTAIRRSFAELAFTHLHAETMATAWFVGNHAAKRLSQKLGYHITGTGHAYAGIHRDAYPTEEAQLSKADYRPGNCQITISGITTELTSMLGASP
ncbi:MAG: GNAT family protein [Corynebacterium sp.]|uniref:GNAT family N-acetyltransferase n=1 Tax=Corynebacterium sp. TaxID=1720 RepID=UPI0026DDC512|nr:GNAT family protein [Corynebacterium sp.]MDO4761851.1 GNAT family protein [Corynebacterium sp.]